MVMRVKRLSISAELLFTLFKAGDHPSYRVIDDAVPDDAKLVNVRGGVQHGWPNTIELLIESALFEEHEEGKAIPQLFPRAVSIS